MNKLSDKKIMTSVKEDIIEMLAIPFERHHVQDIFIRFLKYRKTYTKIKITIILCFSIIIIFQSVFSSPNNISSQFDNKVIFQSCSFSVAGYLRLPKGEGPHPVVIFVHGDGPTDHTSWGYYIPIMKRMLRAGYATFSWDKPGTGESSGQIDRSQLFKIRSQIVIDAIAALKKRPELDHSQMGLWGSSQAGYIIPLVLEKSANVNFLIAVSCPGEASVDQWAFQIKAQALCAGLPTREAELLDKCVSGAAKARTYKEYLQYKNSLSNYTTLLDTLGYTRDILIIPEEQWKSKDLNDREFFNPVLLMEKINIPVLAIYGDKDTQIDPIQGIQAYQRIRDLSGNQNFTIKLVRGVDHSMIKSKSGSLKERAQRTAEEWQTLADEYLDMIEEWLQNLKQKVN